MGIWYLETSAAAKLVMREAESAALDDWRRRGDVTLIGSDLTRAELMRVARRRDPSLTDRALGVLQAVDSVPVSPRLFRAAGSLDPAGLRTLDALHLAVALDLADDLDGLVTYDARLSQAAAMHGLQVAAPGA